MSVYIKISSTLRAYIPGYNPVKGLWVEIPGEFINAAILAESIGLPLGEIKFAMINGRQLPMSTPIKDGDRIAYFPAVGGG